MRLFRTSAAIALAALATLASAQTAPTSPAKKELVTKLMTLQQAAIESVGDRLALQTSQQLLAAASRSLEQIPVDKREVAGKAVQADVRKFYDDIAPTLRAEAWKLAPTTVRPVLEERFSEDELKTVISWLESSASKKFQQISNEVVPALAQKLVAETRPTIEPKIQAVQASIASDLGLPPPAASASAPRSAAAAKPAASGTKK
jgi:hypothetical protein